MVSKLWYGLKTYRNAGYSSASDHQHVVVTAAGRARTGATRTARFPAADFMFDARVRLRDGHLGHTWASVTCMIYFNLKYMPSCPPCFCRISQVCFDSRTRNPTWASVTYFKTQSTCLHAISFQFCQILQVCFDCPTRNPTWASVTYIILLQLEVHAFTICS
eukprot:TRINITY_DN4071_c0_g1_i1.p1 TRINITY_DN4071_c0_g1~~TRINITY_DN4071_c0_g1_i1.p1  ORF type:complete len:162 (+),score=8.36 TRINITY_DN4071_c0_g1_i1:1614-2099(+)